MQATLDLPPWTNELVETGSTWPGDEPRMELVLTLAQENVQRRTGGPFAAAVFAGPSGQLIAVGVNSVERLHNSLAHAETTALALAQKSVGTPRLNEKLPRPVTLYTSAQPCAMCYGAIPWAGIDRLVIAASREDVQHLTDFDEGPIPPEWRYQLTSRQIDLTENLLRDQACEILKAYKDSGGLSY